MISKFKKNPFYYLLLVFTLIRMSWLILKEPAGASMAAKRISDMDPLAAFATRTLPFVVYPSIIILAAIIIGLLKKKNWSYLAALIFGIIHLILVAALVILGVNPGIGPVVVIPGCTGMILFSLLIMRSIKSNSDQCIIKNKGVFIDE